MLIRGYLYSAAQTGSFTFYQPSQFLPAINFRALVWVSKNNFWRGVERAAAKRLQQIFAKNVGEAKVGYFCSAVFVEQNVLQLEVSVADVVLKKLMLKVCCSRGGEWETQGQLSIIGNCGEPSAVLGDAGLTCCFAYFLSPTSCLCLC